MRRSACQCLSTEQECIVQSTRFSRPGFPAGFNYRQSMHEVRFSHHAAGNKFRSTHTRHRAYPSRHDGLPIEIVLLKDKAIIGRTKGDYLNVFSNQPYVSGTHAQIILHSSLKWLIEDLGSTNGTKIENTPLIPHKSYQLKKGQTVEIGFVKFRVE